MLATSRRLAVTIYIAARIDCYVRGLQKAALKILVWSERLKKVLYMDYYLVNYCLHSEALSLKISQQPTDLFDDYEVQDDSLFTTQTTTSSIEFNLMLNGFSKNG